MFMIIARIIAGILLIPISILPIGYARWAFVTFFRALAWTELRWFLFYVRHDTGHDSTIQRIRSNTFCPPTVERCYRLWKFDPGHEAFKGMDSRRP